MPRLVDGLEQIFTDLGIVGNGYKLFFFEYNTTTPKDTYSNQGLTIANTNPVVCDASGRPETDIWGADPSTYKLVLGTPDSVLGNITPVVTLNPINSSDSGSIINLTPLPAAYWGATTGTSTNYVLNPALVSITSYSNVQCFFIDFHTACAASPNIDINDLGAVNLKKYTGQGTKVALGANEIQAQRYLAINDGIDIVILNPLVRSLRSIQTFTSSGTWTKPVGCIAIEVWAIGGGGGSGGAQPGANSGNASGGGGGGGAAYKFITSLNGTETVTIGAGGTAGTTTTAGGDGGTTSFGSQCSATGGKGSINSNGAAGSQVGGAGGAGGVGSSGTINLTGAAGSTAARVFGEGGIGGGGGKGASEFGGGGAAPGATTNTGIAGVAATANTGGGAAGAAADYNAGTSYAGAVGGSGLVVVKEYY